MAKIITICNQKGGCGKTTLTMQLGGNLTKFFDDVLIIDADPQASAIRWAAVASEDSPYPATVIGLSAAESKVHQEVKKLVNKFDIILIDCPPAIESVIPQSALLVSDLALIPIIPSPSDLWASAAILQLVEDIQVINNKLNAVMVPNMCQANMNLTQEVIEILREKQIPLLKTHLHYRAAYRQSAAIGGIVHNIKNADKAIQEVESLTDEILSILK
jgi:chromosome partitioning protein